MRPGQRRGTNFRDRGTRRPGHGHLDHRDGHLIPGSRGPTATTPPPTPGPEATPGCGTLTEPVHRLVHGAGTDREAVSAEVRRLSDGVTDNALSAVASRLSGIAVQPTVFPAALEAQWDQFRRLCDLP
ncbi:hypothetical protein O4090_05365 [Dietzia kunjamensis]|uniref:hypothetical protein n=1 Tax=Dietzia kunjamensis TaxID=322509 RepID=UPI0022B5BBF4|nr:hypothetical protein [Dietzia kunjamensis]MCZ4655398.1 hypothetical protein [Dietzia kunjamensis]